MTIAFPPAQASAPKAPAYGQAIRSERPRAASEAFALLEGGTRPDPQNARKAAPRSEEPLRETRQEKAERAVPERDARERPGHEARHDEGQSRAEARRQDDDASCARAGAARTERASDKARGAPGEPSHKPLPKDHNPQDDRSQNDPSQDGSMTSAMLQGEIRQGVALKGEAAQVEAAKNEAGTADAPAEGAASDSSAVPSPFLPTIAPIVPDDTAFRALGPAVGRASAEGSGGASLSGVATGDAANGQILAIAGAPDMAAAAAAREAFADGRTSGAGEAAAGAGDHANQAAGLGLNLDAGAGGGLSAPKNAFAGAPIPGAPSMASDAAVPAPGPADTGQDPAQSQAQAQGQAAPQPDIVLPPGLEMLMKAARDGAEPGSSPVDGSSVQPGSPHAGRSSELGAPPMTAQGGQPAELGRAMPPSAVPVEIGLRALQGLKEFQIRLDPAELGRVDVMLEIGDDKSVNARVVVERVETLHLLQRDAKTLERAFEQAGLKAGEAGIDISLRDPGQQGRQGQPFEAEDILGEAGRARAADAARIEAAIVPIRRVLHRGALDLSI